MSHRPLLLDRVRTCIRVKHYSISTEEAYVQAIKRYILFHHKRHPQEIGADEIRKLLMRSSALTVAPSAILTQSVCNFWI
jgi:hypothetical protein